LSCRLLCRQAHSQSGKFSFQIKIEHSPQWAAASEASCALVPAADCILALLCFEFLAPSG